MPEAMEMDARYVTMMELIERADADDVDDDATADFVSRLFSELQADYCVRSWNAR